MEDDPVVDNTALSVSMCPFVHTFPASWCPFNLVNIHSHKISYPSFSEKNSWSQSVINYLKSTGIMSIMLPFPINLASGITLNNGRMKEDRALFEGTSSNI